MKWQVKPRLNKEEWHEWFAWYPVRLSQINEIAWLEKIERKVIVGQFDVFVEYRANHK